MYDILDNNGLGISLMCRPSPSFSPLLSSSSWVRWRWMVRLSKCVSRSTVRCRPRPWRLPWTAWTPWTPCLCQDASGCEATATLGRSTRAVLGKRKEKGGGLCFCCHPPHHAHLPPPSEPSRAAQVWRSMAGMDDKMFLYWYPFGDFHRGYTCLYLSSLTFNTGVGLMETKSIVLNHCFFNLTDWSESEHFLLVFCHDQPCVVRQWFCGARRVSSADKGGVELSSSLTGGIFKYQLSSLICC